MSDTLTAKVVEIVEEKQVEHEGARQWYQKIKLETKGGQLVVENGDQPMANVIRYQKGERVMVTISSAPGGETVYQISDYIRYDGLILLTLLFAGVTIAVTRFKGIRSMLGMIFTFGVLFQLVLPQISGGQNPVTVAILASGLIIPVSFYLAHGVNRKTTAAVIGSIIALGLTGLLGYLFINWGYLTGLSTEEAGMLAIDRGGQLNMKGILLAGIVLGALGVLDDITVSQAAIVEELYKTGKLKKAGELYHRAMNVGKDHITSMVNTLVLAYTGASLPLMLMFIDSSRSWGEVLNNEMIAEEIVRTLVGSMGLVLAVPITTALAAWSYKNIKNEN